MEKPYAMQIIIIIKFVLIIGYQCRLQESIFTSYNLMAFSSVKQNNFIEINMLKKIQKVHILSNIATKCMKQKPREIAEKRQYN